MGRPNLIVQWSNSGNFPPGPDPWASRPLAVQPAGFFFTPNTKPAAEDFNYLFGNLAADLQTVYQQGGLIAAQNWREPNTVNTANMGGGAWDPINGVWYFGIVAPDGSPDQSVFFSKELTDNGGVFLKKYGNSVTTIAGNQIQSILVNGNVLLVGMLTNQATTGGTEIHYINSGTFPNWGTAVLIDATGKDIQLDFFAGQFLGFSGHTGAATVVSSPTGTPASWTVASIPASLNNVVKWRTAKSSTAILAFSKGEVSQTKYMRSTDGLTWSERTIALAAGAAVHGVCNCIGPFGPAFVVVASNSGGIGLDTWISYDDGLTFSKIASITRNVWDVAALGSLLVAITQDATGGTYASEYMFSIDGGFTWHWVSHRIFGGILYASRFGVDTRIYAGDIGFFSLNSAMQTFSWEQGVPPYVLT